MGDLEADDAVNIHSAYVAAQQAVAGWAELPASAARTFIYTGNALNVMALPKLMTNGIGKSGAAYMVMGAADAYKGRGYK